MLIHFTEFGIRVMSGPCLVKGAFAFEPVNPFEASRSASAGDWMVVL